MDALCITPAESGSCDHRLQRAEEFDSLLADFVISEHYATRGLVPAARCLGYLKAAWTNSGPELAGSVIGQWPYEHGIPLKLVQQCKPTRNAYIESFHGKQQG